MGSAGDFIRKVAAEAVRAAASQFSDQTGGGNDAASGWFIGKVSSDKNKILHPNGTEYDLVFTGQIQDFSQALIVSPGLAYAIGTEKLRAPVLDGGGLVPWFIAGAGNGYSTSQGTLFDAAASFPEFNLYNGKQVNDTEFQKNP
jgi:hypothetical protein